MPTTLIPAAYRTAVPPLLARELILRELRAMLVLALPLVLAQLTQILVHTTEVVLLGRLGAAPLAAATLFHTAFMFAVGVVSATAPLLSQAKGARQPRRMRRIVRQGLWVTLALALPLMAGLWFVRPLLALMGQDPALLPMTEAYMRMAVWGMPFGVGFIVLRSFASSFGRARPVLAAALAAALVNLPLSWGLIFGRFGLPALGAAGAGLGVAIAYALMFFLLLGWCLLAPPFRRYRVLGRFWHPDWPVRREILRVGLPIGGAVVLEVGLFAVSTLLMGLIGTAELAAHQVALQLASIAFPASPSWSRSASAMRRPSGSGSPSGPATARRAGWVACGLGTAFMATTAILFATAREPLARLFLDPGTPEGAAALGHAVLFLGIAALFQLADGLQVIGIANLRGLKDTTVPMWLAGFGYWLIGFPVCVVLGFLTPLRGVGIWIGLALALAAVALAMILRFHRLTAALRG